MSELHERWAELPVVAVLKGVPAADAPGIGEALVGAGISVIEIPLGAPGALEALEALASALGDRALVGAGRVVSPTAASAVAAAGARLVSSLHTDLAVVAAAKAEGLQCIAGFLTPTEAWAGANAGADALAVFPTPAIEPYGLMAMVEALPPLPRLAVGGVGPTNVDKWRKAGCLAFGLDDALYKPGLQPVDVADRAAILVRKVRDLPA
jgi:2-dehydro-3-deoxyphosphogalactonate aldolase